MLQAYSPLPLGAFLVLVQRHLTLSSLGSQDNNRSDHFSAGASLIGIRGTDCIFGAVDDFIGYPEVNIGEFHLIDIEITQSRF